ncbi:MAG: hypothetical protein IJD98_02710 [Oscillospiraceae bacterium]|nr:hypothetical protein [Oscillospiraceae bacterium]
MALPKITFAGGGERGQYLTHKSNDTTIRFVLNYPGIVDADVLRAATKALVESVDVLHSTFFVDPNVAYWKVNEEMDENNYFHYIRTAGDPAVTAYSLSLLPVYHEDKVQLRVELIQSETASSVLVSISHLCVDGGDGKYLLGKLVEAYNMILATGSAAALEVKDGSRAPEKVYEKLGMSDMKDLMSNPLSSVETAYPYPNTDVGMARVTSKVISAQTMSAARKKAKTVGATANDLLVTAFYRAYAAMDGVDAAAPMSVSSMMDLRRHCVDGDSEGLCNMSGALPTTLENGCTGNFEETLEEIVKQTSAAKENPYAGLEGMPIMHGLTRTMPIWLLQMAIGKIYGKLSLGLTNLGNLKCADYALGELVPNGGLFGGPLKKKPGMQVSVMSFDGECVLACYGRYTAEDAAHIQNTLDSMAKVIEEYAAE